MQDLTFVGLISLNDPPRKGVNTSVRLCQNAGIKVIMVTGDQPNTAAAIAAKVNIISDPKQEYSYMVNTLKMPEHEAWAKCRAIVIHGDKLAERHAEDDMLDDLDVEKNRFLVDWISKPEVVFARTTPSQKLMIVDACQRAGHIVGVTGDGVNDSPAIKKADIGVAMGSGSDVAKNAADIIILDDNFNSIVKGVEEGRLIFDNLKKSIAYPLSSNIPEIVPYILFIILQVPLPLSVVLILAVDLGTDIVPGISFAYENAELDIMDRLPRSAKRDRLVGAKLVIYSYLQTGILQTTAGMYCYWYVMNDYGIPIRTTLYILNKDGWMPAPGDTYNPSVEGKGNSHYGMDEYKTTLIWDKQRREGLDVRLFYADFEPEKWTKCRWDPRDPSVPSYYWKSPITNNQICYTPEALLYAQTAYLSVIVVTQWSNLLICKTRKLSLSQQHLKNNIGNIAIFCPLIILTILVYTPGI